jgi:MFS family permease
MPSSLPFSHWFEQCGPFSLCRVSTQPSPRLRLLLGGLFFLQAHAIALWFVPFSSVLKEHGLEHITAWAFASSGVAAFFSPMLTGVLADRRLSPSLLLRLLALGMALLLSLTFWAIEKGWGAGWVLGFVQVLQFFSAPTWGLTSMLVLAQLQDPGRHFGPLRVWGTYGWMIAGFLVSMVLHADGSTLTGFSAALAWLGVAGFTFLVPASAPQPAGRPFVWKEIFGLETFSILRDPRHRAVFLGAGLLSIPLAAFYPYTPMHLQDLGVHGGSAVMSIGQVSEALSMYAVARLLTDVRLATLLNSAIAVAVLRYVLFATGSVWGVITGVFLHGICFTLFFIPAQIYIEQRIPREMRFRAQALMTLLISGFGNLLGYLGCGALRNWCQGDGQTRWGLYWGVLAGVVAAVWAYFWRAYREPVPVELALSK